MGAITITNLISEVPVMCALTITNLIIEVPVMGAITITSLISERGTSHGCNYNY